MAQSIGTGSLLPALLANAAIPGIFPRVHHDGRSLYDGGVVATQVLIEGAYEAALSFVQDLQVNCPGLYGSPSEQRV